MMVLMAVPEKQCELCGDEVDFLDDGMCPRCFVVNHDGNSTPTGFAAFVGFEPED
jgi:NMD protein affecting ribosome stability and mRNA decay